MVFSVSNYCLFGLFYRFGLPCFQINTLRLTTLFLEETDWFSIKCLEELMHWIHDENNDFEDRTGTLPVPHYVELLSQIKIGGILLQHNCFLSSHSRLSCQGMKHLGPIFAYIHSFILAWSDLCWDALESSTLSLYCYGDDAEKRKEDICDSKHRFEKWWPNG